MSKRKDSLRTCSVDGCHKPAFSRGYCADCHRKTYGGEASVASSSSSSSSSSKSKSSKQAAAASSSSSSSSSSKFSVGKFNTASIFESATVGCDDMILLPNPSERAICENLQMRFKRDLIYTYIGQVLISVNPFKAIKDLYSQGTMLSYSGKASHENAPHIFALAENAWRTMKYEEENQCVIISGESGAGKTEAAKQIMNYISYISGGGASADQIKSMILESNPLLEALGNAKTIRNNNSSRFGKYFSINFDRSGVPRSGYITNYLLEKSRVVFQNKNERNFHIFYQLLAGAPATVREKYSLQGGCGAFHYLDSNGSQCHTIPDVNDEEEFEATRHAMKVTGFGSKEQEAVFSLIAGILHIGNIQFKEEVKNGATKCKVSPHSKVAAELLGVENEELVRIISVRHIKTGKEEYDVGNNLVQCEQQRDALAKALYSRMFDWVVKRVNEAIGKEIEEEGYKIGVLDIYGFEVFQTNGFEQFCINFVNEKLQQIFIELTLKNEQDEYRREGIEWKEIKFFNNKIVCELIEGSLAPAGGGKAAIGAPRLPPGIFSLLDDVCATLHAETKGADKAFTDKVMGLHGNHPHWASAGSKVGFIVKHFAGDVEYLSYDFPSKNADAVNNDLILAMQASTKRLIPVLFPEEVDLDSKKKPPTSGFKIKNQTKDLVAALMASNPHYIRTIKSNDNKRAGEFDFKRVEFQVKYLGLLENLRVRRAGFAYRREFHDFVKRFAMLSPKTWPNEYSGSDKDACKHILKSIQKMRPDLATKEQIQLGKSMIFIKDPETVNEFDQLKLERLGSMVVKFQRLWRHYKKNKEVVEMKNACALFLYKAQKERRRESFYRPYNGLYIEGFRKDVPLMDLLHHYEQPTNLQIVFMDFISLISSNTHSPWAHLQEKFPALFQQQQPLSSNLTLANWKREENILLVVSKENVYIIQQQEASNFFPSQQVHPHHAAGRIRSKTTAPASASAAAARAVSPSKAPPGSFLPPYFLRRLIPLTALSSLTLTPFADTYLALHVREQDRVAQRTPAAWRPDKEVDNCTECGEKFGLFTRRHHCRGCGEVFCWSCTQHTMILPDYSIPNGLKEPQRICSYCFGRESADFMADVLLSSDKRTEIMVVLQDLFKKSPLKTIDIKFHDTIQLCTREHNPTVSPNLPVQFKLREVSFKKSKSGNDRHFAPASDSKAEVLVAPGLAPDFIKERQKRAQKRRDLAAKRKEVEMEERRRRAVEREAEREADRKLRLAEKKRAKAALKAQAEEEALGRNASQSIAVGSSSSKLKSSSSRGPSQSVVVAAVAACNTCGCNSFIANAFKKNKCNNCFHEH